MNGNIHAIARALGGVVSGGQILAPGPGHSPSDRSLCVKLTSGENDGFTIHSFAGDDVMICRDHVRERIGMAPFEFSPAVNGNSLRQASAAATNAGVKSSKHPQMPPADHPKLGKWSARWCYRDEAGSIAGYVCRFDLPDGKRILPLSIVDSPAGLAWRWKALAAPRPLYGLNQLQARPKAPVLVVEGEKSVDAAQALFPDTVVVTSAGGANASANSNWTPLRGRMVTIWPDADEPGAAYADQVAAHLRAAGALTVRVVSTDGLPHSWDLADEIPPELDLADRFNAATTPFAGGPANLISARDLEHKTFPPLQWVVPDYLPEGLALLAGRPKIGKSWLVIDLCIAVARGGYCLSSLKPCREGDVLYCALEDNERRLQRRMRKVASSGWPERLKFLTELPRLEDGGLDSLQRWCEAVESPRLIVIDTLAKIRKSKTSNETDYQADYRAMDGLAKLAARFNMAIVVVHHVRKAESVSDPFDAISGTTGLTGSVDAAIVINRGAMGVTLYARGRDIEELEKAVEFRAADCRWHVLGDSGEIHKSDERRQIIEVLRQADEAIGPAVIARETGMKPPNVRYLLREMLAADDIEKTGVGKYVVRCDASL